MFAADPDLDFRPGGPPLHHRNLHQLPNPGDVKGLEWIPGIDIPLQIGHQEPVGVIAAQSQGSLSQVIGSEAEEVRRTRNFVRGESSSGNLDHGAHLILDLQFPGIHHLSCHLPHDFGLIIQFLDVAYQGDHDLRHGFLPTTDYICGRLEDRLSLHPGDFGIDDSQAAAAKTDHGIELVK